MRINNKNICFKKLISLVLYYSFARYLPVSGSRLGRLLHSKTIRYQLCKRIFAHCGKNVNIERKAFFGTGYSLEIGDNSGLGINCNIPSGTIIGRDVMMGPNCRIYSVNHRFERTDIPMREQGMTEPKQTIIGDDVWIGGDVTIMVGRHIQQGSVVAANCVLTKDFPEYSVIGGNPSRFLKSRK